MNKEKQRILIAEACGKKIPAFELEEEYVDDRHWNSGYWEVTILFADKTKIELFARKKDVSEVLCKNLYAKKHFPDYLNDLNAMHEAERFLEFGYDGAWMGQESDGSACEAYMNHLQDIVKNDDWCFCGATAAQRAEAFLRTIGKWEEEKNNFQKTS